jgi:soluble lytic murein transglycosylase-like protein
MLDQLDSIVINGELFICNVLCNACRCRILGNQNFKFCWRFPMDKNELVLLARLSAAKYSLDPALVCAVCEQESAWNPGAVRFEPAFKARYVDPQGLSEPEATNRATSWGLMQIMGQVAREFGYVEDIPTLTNPSQGLDIGCKVLAHYLSQHSGNVTLALLRYNGGGNPDYAAQVEARMSAYQSPTPMGGVDNATQI